MPDETNTANDPTVPMPPSDDVPAPAQDGMVSVGQPTAKPPSPPSIVPQPLEHDKPAEQTESSTKASDIVKPPTTETISDQASEPTVAELDKSHEKGPEAEPPKNDQKEEKPAKGTQAGSKNTAPWAIVVAILAALLLSGIGFAAWRASNNSAATEEEPTQQTFNESDVDKLNQELERVESEFRQIEAGIKATGLEDEDLGL